MEEIDKKYNEAIKYIEELDSSKSVLGLERIRQVLKLFDNPQDKLKIVHIAGTNGKGSTTTMLSNIYIKSGYKVGTYISPYIIDFRERIQYNGNFIEKEIFSQIVEELKQKLFENNYTLTYFEYITVIAFIYFYRKECDIVFLEVGLGGRLDATNVILNPVLSIITKIDYDHMNILGNTLQEIAIEKCGIIKENSNVVIYPIQEDIVLETIKKECINKKTSFYLPKLDELEIINDDIFNIKIKYKNVIYNIGLNGKYQIYNTITVIKAVDILNELGYKTNIDKTIEAIKNTVFPARFEILSNNPKIIADGAHNESGIVAFIESVKDLKNTPKIGIVSILKDKDIEKMSKIFSTVFDKIIIVPINTLRGSDINLLKNNVIKYNNNVECIEDYTNALDIAKKYCGQEGNIFVFGSLYLISDIRKIIK